MGALGAMRGRGASGSYSKDRYFQNDAGADEVVPEGIEGRVPYRGEVANFVAQFIGGLHQSMFYCGAADLTALKAARFVRITGAGLAESHPHDIQMMRESPNYRPR
jgi:IMP dehydrogenase